MPDDAAEFLVGARQEARNVHEVDDRNVERVAEPDEPGRFVRSIAVQATGHVRRLVGDNADGRTVEPGKTGDDVHGVMFLDFQEFAVVHRHPDDILHVVRHVRIVRHDGLQAFVLAVRAVAGFHDRCVFHVVGRQEAQQVPHFGHAVLIIFRREVRHARYAVVGHRAAQGFRGDFFGRNGFDDLRAGDEHLAGVLYHEDPVGQGRGIHRAARRRSHDAGDLGNNTGSQGVFEEDLAVAGQSVNRFLDPRAA